MENMKSKGMQFVPGAVDEWLDCGNYAATVYTNQRVLANKAAEFIGNAARFDESVTIHEPCFIGENVSLKNCVIGPHTSIGNHSTIVNCTITNSIIQEQCSLSHFQCHDSLIGNHVVIKGSNIASQEYSLGDFCSIG